MSQDNWFRREEGNECSLDENLFFDFPPLKSHYIFMLGHYGMSYPVICYLKPTLMASQVYLLTHVYSSIIRLHYFDLHTPVCTNVWSHAHDLMFIHVKQTDTWSLAYAFFPVFYYALWRYNWHEISFTNFKCAVWLSFYICIPPFATTEITHHSQKSPFGHLSSLSAPRQCPVPSANLL